MIFFKLKNAFVMFVYYTTEYTICNLVSYI